MKYVLSFEYLGNRGERKTYCGKCEFDTSLKAVDGMRRLCLRYKPVWVMLVPYGLGDDIWDEWRSDMQ